MLCERQITAWSHLHGKQRVEWCCQSLQGVGNEDTMVGQRVQHVSYTRWITFWSLMCSRVSTFNNTILYAWNLLRVDFNSFHSPKGNCSDGYVN